MKKLLSVVVVFVLLVAMSVSAFAAAPTTAQNEDGSWTTAGEDATYANSMMTILAYTEGQAISVDSIQYIDQTTADANGAYSFANYLPKVDPTDAKYVVLVGGQKIAEPLAAGYIEAAATDVTITGVVTKTGDLTGATIALLNGEEVVASTTADAVTGAFTLTAPAGTYTLKITKPGHTKYINYSVDISTLAENATYALYAGNANGDQVVGVTDITAVILGLDNEVTTDNKDVDVNDDNIIGVTDITSIILNLDKVDTEVNAPVAE